MKSLTFFLIMLIVITDLNGQVAFKSTLTGEVQAPVKKVYLKIVDEGRRKLDSANVVNKHFQFNIERKVPCEATLYTDQNLKPISLFLENGNYVFSIDKAGIQLLKSPVTQQHYMNFVEITNNTVKLFPIYEDATKAKDSLQLQKLSVKFDSLRLLSSNLAKEIFDSNPKSSLALFLFEKFASESLDYSLNEPSYLQLPNWAKATQKGKDIAALIEGAKRTILGMQAPDFTSRDTSGNLVSLSDFKGKFLLIDFWASWCKPCREENPVLRKAYEEYKDNGLEILGVSLEFEGGKASWMKAIEKDQLPWKHISGLALFNDPVAILYGIQSIPQNYLIDPSGKLIAKNLRGDALFKKLEELFK